MLYDGSLVVVPRRPRSICATASQWWTFMKSADWRNPTGPKEHIKVDLDDYPVVHVRCTRLRQMGSGRIFRLKPNGNRCAGGLDGAESPGAPS